MITNDFFTDLSSAISISSPVLSRLVSYKMLMNEKYRFSTLRFRSLQLAGEFLYPFPGNLLAAYNQPCNKKNGVRH